MTTDKQLGQHAIVIGGSLAGLLSARVLSDHYEQVTVFERDTIPDEHEPRKHVPQGRHVHVIYGGGANVVERLLPGIFDEMVAGGTTKMDFAEGLAWHHQGVWKMRFNAGLPSYWQSRPYLEGHIRQRVLQIDNIHHLPECDVVTLLSNDDKTRVTGVRVVSHAENNHEEDLEADLVVDASGRNSSASDWLTDLGYEAPPTTKVDINLAYATRTFERPAANGRDWEAMGIFPLPPKNKRVGYIFPIEGNRWIASLVGYLGDHPPDDDEGYMDYAKSLDQPHFYEAVKDAKPLTPVAKFKYPAQVRRHYESVKRLPAGLISIADAVCSFNPVYGQGMSACALQVEALEQTIASCATGNGLPDQFPRDFYSRIAKIIDNPWLLATSSDFFYPETGGKRPFGIGILNWYLARVLQLCSCNRRVLKTFMEVLNFMKPPSALFHPAIVTSALLRGIGLTSYNDSSEIPAPGER